MTPALCAVHDELLARASKPPMRARANALREQFLRRTASATVGDNVWAVLAAKRGASARADAQTQEVEGDLSSHSHAERADGSIESDTSDPESEMLEVCRAEREDRMRAAWDYALIRGGLAAELAPTFSDPAERALVHVLSRAHRGVFRLRAEKQHMLAVDVVDGAEFLMLARDDVVRATPEETLDTVLFDGRIVAATDGCAFLPGVVFHPADAIPLLDRIVQTARQMRLGREQLCDALLRMQDGFTTMSRVKIAFAYSPEALAHAPFLERSRSS